MKADVRMMMTPVVLASLLFLTDLARDLSAAIVLDNDVDIGVSDTTPCDNRGFECTGVVIGAPRLLSNPSDDIDDVILSIDINPNAVILPLGNTARLTFTFYEVNGMPFCQPFTGPDRCSTFFTLGLFSLNAVAGTCQPVVRPVTVRDCVDSVFLKDFQDFQSRLPTRPLIFTVQASFFLSIMQDPVKVVTTLSGPGNEIIVDRLGDVSDTQAGVALDIPPRSMELARALIQLEDNRGKTRGVNFDTRRPRRADAAHVVGFTHAVDLPAESIKHHPDVRHDDRPNRRIHGATLSVSVKRDDPPISTDFILLDRAVNALAVGRRAFPLVLFCHLTDVPGPDPGSPRTLEINLKRVPVVFTPPTVDDPCPQQRATLNLLDDLSDGRLNVIVADDDPVDFSDLRITLFDPVE